MTGSRRARTTTIAAANDRTSQSQTNASSGSNVRGARRIAVGGKPE
jgi:hypothetical protein